MLSGCELSRPRPDSIEYRVSWGLRVVDADGAYDLGASGRGVTIALLDCGVEHAPADVERNLLRTSTDLIPNRVFPQPEPHANLVAGPMDSALDGRGLVGVAYNAKLLSVRADFDGGFEGQCAFYPQDLARGIDYAREHGARILAMPLEGRKPLGDAFEDALKCAVDAGMAVVIAAGNESADHPTWPARYAADPRFAGSIVVAGAAQRDGTFADWSNRAGDTALYYIIAPGEHVVTSCGRKWCQQASGTSFAVPYIAGGLALVMGAHPDLNGRDAIDALLRGARPVGPQEQTGRGALDIGRAFDLMRQPRA
jgi:subtilisin family serine protease